MVSKGYAFVHSKLLQEKKGKDPNEKRAISTEFKSGILETRFLGSIQEARLRRERYSDVYELSSSKPVISLKLTLLV